VRHAFDARSVCARAASHAATRTGGPAASITANETMMQTHAPLEPPCADSGGRLRLSALRRRSGLRPGLAPLRALFALLLLFALGVLAAGAPCVPLVHRGAPARSGAASPRRAALPPACC
jgi:hypothetical protein